MAKRQPKRFGKAVTFRMPPELDEQLEAFASEMGWTKTDTIAVALDHLFHDVAADDRLKALGTYKARNARSAAKKAGR